MASKHYKVLISSKWFVLISLFSMVGIASNIVPMSVTCMYGI